MYAGWESRRLACAESKRKLGVGIAAVEAMAAGCMAMTNCGMRSTRVPVGVVVRLLMWMQMTVDGPSVAMKVRVEAAEMPAAKKPDGEHHDHDSDQHFGCALDPCREERGNEDERQPEHE